MIFRNFIANEQPKRPWRLTQITPSEAKQLGAKEGISPLHSELRSGVQPLIGVARVDEQSLLPPVAYILKIGNYIGRFIKK